MTESNHVDRVIALTSLPRGTRVLCGGDKLLVVPDTVCDRFVAGDALVVVEASEQVLLIPAAERALVAAAVGRACAAFEQVRSASDSAISAFFEDFARRLESDANWSLITTANAADVTAAQQRGRSTTRLRTSESMRR
ncbi:MAG TPA: hypothetical protein VK509_21085, partial [Polyangiales bacterium]|nr:hypothetical protein [Polyangiales bacterium]